MPEIPLESAVLLCGYELEDFHIGCKGDIPENKANLPLRFGAISPLYPEGLNARIEYWATIFCEIKINMRIDHKKYIKRFIKIRTQFEDMVFGEDPLFDKARYLLPRDYSENVDNGLRQHIRSLINKTGLEQKSYWFLDTTGYWNHAIRKIKNEDSDAYALCVQNLGHGSCSSPYDNLYLNIELKKLKNNGKDGMPYMQGIGTILQLANYTGLLLNCVEKLEKEVRDLKKVSKLQG